mgnify:CR=1 FL=1
MRWHATHSFVTIAVDSQSQSRIGSTTASWEHFAEWKTMSGGDAERGRPQLQLIYHGEYTYGDFVNFINRCKDELVTPDEWRFIVDKLGG